MELESKFANYNLKIENIEFIYRSCLKIGFVRVFVATLKHQQRLFLNNFIKNSHIYKDKYGCFLKIKYVIFFVTSIYKL